MGREWAGLFLGLLAGCAAQAVPTARPAPAPAPVLPAATYQQVVIPEPAKAILRLPSAAPAPCVLDVQAALSATPEVKQIRSEDYEEDSTEYHMLVVHANDRMRIAARRAAARRGFDLVMDLGAIRLRPGIRGVAVADITRDVLDQIEPREQPPTPKERPAEELLADADLQVMDASLIFIRLARAMTRLPEERAELEWLRKRGDEAAVLFTKARLVYDAERGKAPAALQLDRRLEKIGALINRLQDFGHDIDTRLKPFVGAP